MRWRQKKKTQNGEVRIIKKFCILPKKLRENFNASNVYEEWRWLEWVYIHQVYSNRWCSIAWAGSRDEQFLDKLGTEGWKLVVPESGNRKRDTLVDMEEKALIFDELYNRSKEFKHSSYEDQIAEVEGVFKARRDIEFAKETAKLEVSHGIKMVK